MYMEKPRELPWPKRDVFIQLGFVLGVAVYAGVILALAFWPLAVVFAVLCASFVIVNHYFVCRDCAYHGTLCGSFGLGRLALFKRTGKEHFDPKTAQRSMVFFYITAAFPVLAVLFQPAFWWLAAIYLTAGGVSVLVHNKLGCAKCPLVHCSGNPGHKKMQCI